MTEVVFPIVVTIALMTGMILLGMPIMVTQARLMKGQLDQRNLKYIAWVVPLGFAILFSSHLDNVIAYVAFGFLAAYIVLFLLAIRRQFRARKYLSKAVVIPEYKNKHFKFYEVGVLDHSRIQDNDMLAIFANIVLNKRGKDLDHPVECAVVDNFSLSDMKNLKSSIYLDGMGQSYAMLLNRVFSPIYNNLLQKGYLAYNARMVIMMSTFLMLFSIFPVMFGAFYRVAKVPEILSQPLQFFGGMGFAIFFLLLIYAEDFAENLDLILPERVKLRGYKMYLERAEYYRLEHDPVTFRKVIPYMISLGIRKDKLKEMVEVVRKDLHEMNATAR